MIDLSPTQATDRITALLAAHESRTLDFKRISGKQGRMYEAFCAFANTDGGLLVMGIGDAKAMKPSDKPQSRLFGIEENLEGFDNFRTELLTRFTPAITKFHWIRVPCTLYSGQPGHVVLLRVDKSDQVHVIIGNGTWTRMDASNRELSAAEIADLAYQRGVRSAETLPMPVALDVLNTDAWRSYCFTRGLADMDLAVRLPRLGLAVPVDGALQPLLAALLLFADEPGALLAGQGMRADIRVFHYKGRAVLRGEIPNLLLPPKTITGPTVEQISKAQAYVLDRLAVGLTMEGSGFKTRYRFPERVIKEAITNAVVHRDYRLNRDIQIRIFDDRVEVESPGRLPGSLTPATIEKTGSVPRNGLLARHLREFSNPPNVDAGEGVPMMFAQMAQASLYEPLYREQLDAAVPTLVVTLLNEERPPLWVQVSDWIDRNGPIANAKLREISSLDTLASSKQLRKWVAQGVLVALPAASRQQASYTKPELAGLMDLTYSLSLGLDNENENEKKPI
ncbi:MAG: putative DNA binding domain-containing protein [Candidatus Saccharibacteria bacterium]|nr:putative DNA binding domain-containing protein [Rhodoferax sp.]